MLPSRPSAAVRRRYSDCMSRCARMLARIPGPRPRTWLAASPALDARGRGETTFRSQTGAAVNPPRINDFSPFERTALERTRRLFSRPTPQADALRGDRVGCAHPVAPD